MRSPTARAGVWLAGAPSNDSSSKAPALSPALLMLALHRVERRPVSSVAGASSRSTVANEGSSSQSHSDDSVVFANCAVPAGLRLWLHTKMRQEFP
jgi:hypothetical protein